MGSMSPLRPLNHPVLACYSPSSHFLHADFSSQRLSGASTCLLRPYNGWQRVPASGTPQLQVAILSGTTSAFGGLMRRGGAGKRKVASFPQSALCECFSMILKLSSQSRCFPVRPAQSCVPACSKLGNDSGDPLSQAPASYPPFRLDHPEQQVMPCIC